MRMGLVCVDAEIVVTLGVEHHDALSGAYRAAYAHATDGHSKSHARLHPDEEFVPYIIHVHRYRYGGTRRPRRHPHAGAHQTHKSTERAAHAWLRAGLDTHDAPRHARARRPARSAALQTFLQPNQHLHHIPIPSTIPSGYVVSRDPVKGVRRLARPLDLKAPRNHEHQTCGHARSAREIAS